MMGAFTKNMLITFITRVVTAIFGIGITIIIARVLGPKGQGIYSLAILLPLLLVTFTNFGINSASVFYIGKKKYSPKEVFGGNIIFTIFLSIFAILIGLIIVFFFSNRLFPGVERIHLFLALSLIPLFIFFDFTSHVLLGLQKIKKYNFTSFLQSFFFLILVGILLLGLRLGITAAIFGQVFSYILAGIILFFITRKETEGLILKLNKQYFKDAFSYGFKVYLGGVSIFLHYRIALFLINFFINPIAVGFYYIAARLAEGIWLFSTSAATVLFPKVASEQDPKQLKEFTPLVSRNILFITFLISVLLFIFSHWIIILFYSEKFLESVRPFQILLIGTSFAAGWQILANDIQARGKPMLNTYVISFSLVLNIILNILWIPKWGIEGAAWATVVSYLAMLIVTVFVYKKISGNKIKDIVFFQKSDIGFYKNVLINIKNLRTK